jgi:hypothetical protein
MSKLSIFDPDAVRHTNYTPGRHAALPLGDLRLPAHDEIRNLHYKYVGHARLIERQRTLHAGLGPLDHARRWGEQYGWEQQRTLAAYEHYAARAIDASDPALDTGRTHPSRWWRTAPEPIPAGPQTDAALHRHLWSGAEGYLDTARRGLAPDLDPEGDLAGARAAFGRLIGVPADAVAACAGLRQAGRAIARTLPRRSRVLAPDGDPTPLAPRRARRVPDLAAAIDARTSLVVLSAVRPDGTLADLGAVTAAARHHGARIALDATQACGWLPLDGSAYDHVACATHTWLLGPAGGAFVTGVATRAPACDWAAAQTSIELLDAIGIERIHTHAVALADRLRSRLGLPLGDTPIVPAPDGHWIAFHLYSGEADADALDGGALRREARGTRVRRQRTDWAPSP